MTTEVKVKSPGILRASRLILAALFALLIGFTAAGPSNASSVQAPAAAPMAAARPASVPAAGPQTDCGPVVQVVCKKIWDKTTTKSFYKAQNQWWWAWVRAKYVAKLSPMPGVVEGDRALDRWESATADAVVHDGCLQATYRKDGKGLTDWGYTTDCRAL